MTMRRTVFQSFVLPPDNVISDQLARAEIKYGTKILLQSQSKFVILILGRQHGFKGQTSHTGFAILLAV